MKPTLRQYSLSLPLIFSDVLRGQRKGILVQNKLETYFLFLILYLWSLVFFYLQPQACFVVIAFVVFFRIKELTQDCSSTAQVSLKNMQLCINMPNIPMILLPWCFLSGATAQDLFLCRCMYLFFGFVEAETLPLVFAFFTDVILFILCARKSRLCFTVGKKRKHQFAVFIIFSPVATLRSILAVQTVRIIIRGWRSVQHFQDNYCLRKHRNLEH